MMIDRLLEFVRCVIVMIVGGFSSEIAMRNDDVSLSRAYHLLEFISRFLRRIAWSVLPRQLLSVTGQLTRGV